MEDHDSIQPPPPPGRSGTRILLGLTVVGLALLAAGGGAVCLNASNTGAAFQRVLFEANEAAAGSGGALALSNANAGVTLNRKMLSQVAIEDPKLFDTICEKAVKASKATPKAKAAV